MRFGICNELFEGWEFARVCEFAAQTGYDAVEIAPFTLGKPVIELSKTERASMRRAADDAGISIAGLHWLLAKTEGFYVNHPDSTVRRRTAEYLSLLARLCGDLGGSIMVFGSPKQRDVYEGLTYEQALDLAAETFASVTPALEQSGVTLCIEPLGPEETNFINTAAEARHLIEKVAHPSFSLMLDVKAMSTESRPIPEIIRDCSSVVRHIHANDPNRRGPGFGEVDFYPIMKALKEISFGGFISVEVFDFLPDPQTVAERSLQYMKACLSETASGGCNER